ncbi:short transient receptor potential channel 4-like isoform X1 [Hyposmocoma kahamanoa]|uniref:short transient receptor potential channel 4-like isoform X1 n=1 Tax=Hyposmocoma kahamanoa TaxID=1477025 RepID=UPI000E6D67E0|nr:short transient receptor potential channel 4-like isoform X1 [Hyposmocoma kahamanoa]
MKAKTKVQMPHATSHRISESDEISSKLKLNTIHLPRLQTSETQFLNLVSQGYVEAVANYLKDYTGLNVNCANYQGTTALHLAVQNRSEAMVEFLLRQPNIEIGDTVLHAVRNGNATILEMLLDAQKKISPGLEYAGAPHSMDFPSHITPIMLAAHLENYETVAFLIARGHTIVKPHHPWCQCIKCNVSQIHDDPLYTNSARLAAYRAICSPAYLIQKSSDPILAAFTLCAELMVNAEYDRHLAVSYMQLRDTVSTFAVDLIGCCRTSEEVELILTQTTGTRGRRQFVLPRLLMAVDHKQKEFVAHPNTQQVLESHWMGDWYSWRNKCFLEKVGIIIGRMFITPLILLMCMMAPRASKVRHWSIPLNKLITHTSAYFIFLGLVFYISNQDKTKQSRGPPNTGAEAPLVLYICGYTWSAIRMCLMQGPRRYFCEMWNWAEILMISLFGFTFLFWVLAALDVAINDEEHLERKYWNQYDPTLVAEGTFCLATIFSYFRLMMFCQLNYHLGPLQVSLGKMTIDIYKYMIVFTIILCAFGAGLARLYQYYDGMVYEDEFGMKTVQVSSFTSLRDTLNTLFWALFCMAPLESADVVLENTENIHVKGPRNNRHAFTERIGYFCFGCFEVISVIVVLNMLIATMSNTFQRVTDNVAIEWTFGRTQVYVDFIWQTTVPSPYNMIPTAAAMSSIVDWLRCKLGKLSGAKARWSLSYCFFIERDLEKNLQEEFPALMSVLVQRYFKQKGNIKDTTKISNTRN